MQKGADFDKTETCLAEGFAEVLHYSKRLPMHISPQGNVIDRSKATKDG
jgi:hypothetical protein